MTDASLELPFGVEFQTRQGGAPVPRGATGLAAEQVFRWRQSDGRLAREPPALVSAAGTVGGRIYRLSAY